MTPRRPLLALAIAAVALVARADGGDAAATTMDPRAGIAVVEDAADPPISARPPVVPKLFIPGLKGSRLVDPAGRLRWVGTRQVLGLGGSLALPLAWEDATQASDGLRADGVLAHVQLLSLPIVGAIVKREVYGPWLAYGRTRWGAGWHEFAYDWRRDNEETLVRFGATVDALAAAAGRPIDVIAHSMGGLILLAHLLGGGDRAIRRAVFAGVPFAGGIAFLPDMQEGSAVGLNHRLLSADAHFSFPSVYALFPAGPSSALASGSPLHDRDGAPIPIDFFVADDWWRQGLGIFAAPNERTPERVRFLTRALAQAARFRARLAPDPGTLLTTALLTITGRGHPTLVQAVKDGPRARRGWDFAGAPRVDGDGRLRVEASLPPPPLATNRVFTTAEHAELLNDPAVEDAIAAFLD